MCPFRLPTKLCQKYSHLQIETLLKHDSNKETLFVLDAKYADKLKAAAMSLYDFANDYRGIYSECYPNAKSFYGYVNNIIKLFT